MLGSSTCDRAELDTTATGGCTAHASEGTSKFKDKGNAGSACVRNLQAYNNVTLALAFTMEGIKRSDATAACAVAKDTAPTPPPAMPAVELATSAPLFASIHFVSADTLHSRSMLRKLLSLNTVNALVSGSAFMGVANSWTGGSDSGVLYRYVVGATTLDDQATDTPARCAGLEVAVTYSPFSHRQRVTSV